MSERLLFVVAFAAIMIGIYVCGRHLKKRIANSQKSIEDRIDNGIEHMAAQLRLHQGENRWK